MRTTNSEIGIIRKEFKMRTSCFVLFTRDLAVLFGSMGLDEQPHHHHAMIYQQSEAYVATGDSGFESHEIISPPPGFSPQPPAQQQIPMHRPGTVVKESDEILSEI